MAEKSSKARTRSNTSFADFQSYLDELAATGETKDMKPPTLRQNLEAAYKAEMERMRELGEVDYDRALAVEDLVADAVKRTQKDADKFLTENQKAFELGKEVVKANQEALDEALMKHVDPLLAPESTLPRKFRETPVYQQGAKMTSRPVANQMPATGSERLYHADWRVDDYLRGRNKELPVPGLAEDSEQQKQALETVRYIHQLGATAAGKGQLRRWGGTQVPPDDAESKLRKLRAQLITDVMGTNVPEEDQYGYIKKRQADATYYLGVVEATMKKHDLL